MLPHTNTLCTSPHSNTCHMIRHLVLLYLITVSHWARSALHEVLQDETLIRYRTAINPLALELDIYSLAHHLCET